MSAILDFRQLQKQIASNESQPVYLLYGEDVYLKDEAIKLIQENTVPLEAKDFNIDHHFCSDTDVYRVKDIVETVPVMTSKRLVIYQGVEKLKEADWQIFKPLLESPISTCVLLLTASKVDKRKKYFKETLKKAIVVELKTPYENQIPQWINYMASQLGVEISMGAAQVLQQLVGSQLLELKCQLEKLLSFVGEKKQIEEADVLEVVPRLRVDSIFQLTDAIGLRDRATALIYLDNLLNQGQSAIGVLAMILRHMRILLDLDKGVKEGLRGQKLSLQAGVPSYFLKQYEQQLQWWDQKSIENIIEVLHETDMALKSSLLSSHIWLENLIIQACSLAGQKTNRTQREKSVVR